MNNYPRRRVAIIGVGILAAILLIVLYVVNTSGLRVDSVDPSGDVLPTAQQSITIKYNQKIVDAKVTSMTTGITYTTSVKDDEFTIKLDQLQEEGVRVALTVSATSAQGSLETKLLFTAKYVRLQDMSEEQQALLTDDSAGFAENYPLVGNIPHVDVSGPYSIDYGERSAAETMASLVISDSTPDGRIAAIKWIAEQGVDPTTIDIRYDEYVNPLTTGGSL
ncbi:MAG: hypothetical protein ABIP74_00010 [Candidatus Saccharimonas sp.]